MTIFLTLEDKKKYQFVGFTLFKKKVKAGLKPEKER